MIFGLKGAQGPNTTKRRTTLIESEYHKMRSDKRITYLYLLLLSLSLELQNLLFDALTVFTPKQISVNPRP